MTTLTPISQKRGYVLFWLMLFVVPLTMAQQKNNVTFNNARFLTNSVTQKITSGKVHLFAVMVEFQPDSNRFTSGDGTFNPDYLDSDEIKIGPLPHDQAYFEAHLEFTKRYFEKVSNGQLEVDYRVDPRVFRLQNEMKEYAPLGEDGREDFKITRLLEDTWSTVEQQGGIDITGWESDRIVFILFHAGAGRDFDLLNTTLDRTPQDIPSIYLNLPRIRSISNNPTFEGYALNNGTLFVDHTIILPETESRRGEIFEEEFILQLGINGLTVASVANHLGLPDLFNTLEGSSAIGRFGLMDPEGFFAYFGLFPPYPSAFERNFMGWDSPILLNEEPEESTILLPAAETSAPQRNAQYQVTGDTYFLIENRHRNVDESGLTVTFQRPDGALVERTYPQNDEKFTVFDQDSLLDVLEAGVIIDVSNYDWALPGGIDPGNDNETGTSDDRLLLGGMLIWQVDQAVIDSRIGTNDINGNEDRRGLSLREADGAQDIGRPTDNIFLSNVIGGTAFDFWWKGNNYTVITETGDSLRVYENRFGTDTRPNSRLYNGAPSFFEAYDFSDNLVQASFKYRKTSGTLVASRKPKQPLAPNTPLRGVPQGFAQEQVIALDTVLLWSGSSVYVYEIQEERWSYPSAVLPPNHQHKVSTFVSGSETVKLLSHYEVNGVPFLAGLSFQNGQWGLEWETELTFTGRMITKHPDGWKVQGSGEVVDAQTGSILSSDGSNLETEVVPEGNAMYENGAVVWVEGSTQTKTSLVTLGEEPEALGLFQPSLDEALFVMVQSEEGLGIYSTESGESYQFTQSLTSLPAIADLDGDDQLDMIYIDKERNELIASYFTGAVLDNFRIVPPKDTRFVGMPVVVELREDGRKQVLALVSDSLSVRIHAWEDDGSVVDEFPLHIGEFSIEALPLLVRGKSAFSLDAQAFAQEWIFPTMKEIVWWGPYNGNDGNHWTVMSSTASNPSGGSNLLNVEETYNWPNPAQDETVIRFKTNETAQISIEIISMSGNMVWNTSTTSNGKTPGEVFINTSNWGSGLYYGRVKATSGSNQSSKLIKIVIVH